MKNYELLLVIALIVTGSIKIYTTFQNAENDLRDIGYLLDPET